MNIDYGHHPICNYWNRPIGDPGCQCVVITKNELKELKELENQVVSLQNQLANAQKTIEQYRNYSRKSYRDDYDYLPYEENYDRE